MNGAAARPRRLHPIIPVIALVKQVPEMLVPMVGVVALARDGGLGTLSLAVVGLLAVFFAVRVLAWWRFTYTLLPHEMYIESGIVSRNRRSIPWDRVQDVEIERGPIARVLGLAKVKLETGGSGGDEGLLDSIALGDALALRDEVRARRGMVVSASPHEAEAAAPPVFKMTVPRILQAGLFNFSVVWLAIIVGAMQYFDDFLPWSIDDVEEWIGVHQQDIRGLVSPVTIALALGLFIVLGTVAGVIQMFVRNYGFTLSLEGRTLRRVRGLLTRSEVAIPLRRIQAARTATHWLLRRYGLCRADVQTMAGASSGGVQELAPLATASEAARVLAIAGGFERIAPERFAPVAAIHPWYDAQLGALPLALIVLAAGFVSPPIWWGLVFVGFLGTVQVIGARPHGWRLEGEMLHVRHGWFAQDHWLLPLANIQSVSLSRGPLQRRLDLATVAIDSAGGQAGGLRIRNLAVNEARALVEVLRTRRRRSGLPAERERDEDAGGAVAFGGDVA
ncbi:MAG: PH domain-containing protein [Alphaproteobacteria bacterium]|nr:PH domain-containing protein [Alphaproteobacteria bacterium]